MSPPRDIAPEVVSALRACRLWSSASDAAIRRLAEQVDTRTVRRGETLATEGEPATRFGVVIAGKARVYYLGADGKRITYEDLGSGEPFSAVAALARGRNPANVEASTDGTVAWLPQEALFDLIAEEPDVATSMVSDLAYRLVLFTSVVKTLALDVPSRLARFLFQRSLAVGQTTPTGLLVDLGMTKGELAAALGTVPETLSRAFARLKEDGVLEVRNRAVVVRDVGALARLGSGYEEG
ncbi:MAG: Crp/Fnr family transcriptional regulator [Coriobacteriia bacterium]|nr:Crp/Fnr family transcriptional regulator [Coriobacteriia bacterium]